VIQNLASLLTGVEASWGSHAAEAAQAFDGGWKYNVSREWRKTCAAVALDRIMIVGVMRTTLV
jgi:hypothetical protein